MLGAAPLAAPAFAFALELDGLRAQDAVGGGLDFVDADGAVRFAAVGPHPPTWNDGWLRGLWRFLSSGSVR